MKKRVIKALIVDDENKGQKNMEFFLTNYCENIEIVGIASSVKEAYRLVEEQAPDLVFLDIEMPKENGFQLLEKYESVPFEVIFTTAYDQYAIKAIKYSALDYILKPIDIDELENAIEKVVAKLEKKAANPEVSLDDQIKTLIHNLSSSNSPKVAIPVAEGLELIEINDIYRCQSASNYTYMYLGNGRKLTIPKTLSDIEAMLPSEIFIRVHKSHLVNKNHVNKYVKNEGSYVVMKDDSRIDVSRRKKTEVDQLLTTMSLG